MSKTNVGKSASKRVSREESQAQTRASLMETATRLLVENGYGGTSIRDIAEQSGYSQGAFYSNFESKEVLLLELLRRHMHAEAEQLAALFGDEQCGSNEILDKLQVWSATIDQDVNWSMLSIELQLHTQRSATFALAYETAWLEHRAALAHWIERLFASCKVQAPASAEEIASSFMALVHGLTLQRAATGSSAEKNMIVVLLRGLIALGKKSAD